MLVDASPSRGILLLSRDIPRTAMEAPTPFTLPALAGDESPTDEKSLAATGRLLDFQTLLRHDSGEELMDGEVLIATNAVTALDDSEEAGRWLEYCETIIPGLGFGFCLLTEEGADPRRELTGWTYINPNKLPPSAVERLLALASTPDDPYDPPVVAAYRGFITGRVDEQGRITTGGGELCGFFVKDPASLGLELSTSVAGAISVATQLTAEWDMLQARNSASGSFLFDLFGDMQSQGSPAAALPMGDAGDIVPPL